LNLFRKEFLAGLVKSKSNLLDLVGAQGVAVYFDNNVFVIGKTPEQADIQDLIEWLESKTYNDVFILILTKIYPEAEKFM